MRKNSALRRLSTLVYLIPILLVLPLVLWLARRFPAAFHYREQTRNPHLPVPNEEII